MDKKIWSPVENVRLRSNLFLVRGGCPSFFYSLCVCVCVCLCCFAQTPLSFRSFLIIIIIISADIIVSFLSFWRGLIGGGNYTVRREIPAKKAQTANNPFSYSVLFRIWAEIRFLRSPIKKWSPLFFFPISTVFGWWCVDLWSPMA